MLTRTHTLYRERKQTIKPQKGFPGPDLTASVHLPMTLRIFWFWTKIKSCYLSYLTKLKFISISVILNKTAPQWKLFIIKDIVFFKSNTMDNERHPLSQSELSLIFLGLPHLSVFSSIFTKYWNMTTLPIVLNKVVNFWPRFSGDTKKWESWTRKL